jgi:hypothetical protein
MSVACTSDRQKAANSTTSKHLFTLNFNMVRHKRTVAACTLAVLVCWAATAAWQHTKHSQHQRRPTTPNKERYDVLILPLTSGFGKHAGSMWPNNNSSAKGGAVSKTTALPHTCTCKIQDMLNTISRINWAILQGIWGGQRRGGWVGVWGLFDFLAHGSVTFLSDAQMMR